ncbi:MAG: 1-acyl-sn-glycerol-3-phosphate acyltransferase [bacterium]|nr:MAG: 1-acyl-sn-glycerol-3-phosphate acyltransferase [bacterium]
MGLKSLIIGTRAVLLIPLVTAFSGLLAILASYFDPDAKFIYPRIGKRWARVVLWLAAARVTIKGLENFPPPGQPCIIVMNHQSNLDIPLMVFSMPMAPRFIGKIELSRIPVFGGAAHRTGQIFIDRSDHEKALEGIRHAARAVKEKGHSVIIAPEGTRSADGRLRPFKKGAFVMAIEMGLPILPVVIEGTHRVLPKGSLWSRGGPVTVTILQKVSTEGLSYDQRDALAGEVHRKMARVLGEAA